MQHENWKCPKCSNRQFEVGEVRAAGSGFASMFDFENRRFTSVTCARCNYTEFYRADAETVEQVMDFFIT
jgi:predicted nucleic-acid-binding Zn-ribbon protein